MLRSVSIQHRSKQHTRAGSTPRFEACPPPGAHVGAKGGATCRIMQRVLPEVSVLSQTRFPEAVGSGAEDDVRPEFILKSKTSPNSSPNCMPKRLQIVLFALPYSFEIISFPGFTIPLLTDRLKVRFLPRPPFRSCRKTQKAKLYFATRGPYRESISRLYSSRPMITDALSTWSKNRLKE